MEFLTRAKYDPCPATDQASCAALLSTGVTANAIHFGGSLNDFYFGVVTSIMKETRMLHLVALP